MPDSMIAAIRSEVPTGRRMKGSETFIAPFYLSSRPRAARRRRSLLAVVAPVLRTLAVRILSAAPSWGPRGRRPGAARRLAVERGDVDVKAFAQPVGAVDHHMIAGGKPGIDRGQAAVRRTDRDRPHRYGVVGVDHVHVGTL